MTKSDRTYLQVPRDMTRRVSSTCVGATANCRGSGTEPFTRLNRETAHWSRDAILAIIDQVVVSGATFFSTVLVGRCSAVEEFGTYALANSILLTLSSLQATLLTTPYLVKAPHLSNRPIALRRYTGAMFLAQVALLGIAVVGFSAIAVGCWFTHYQQWSPLLLFLGAISLPRLLREFLRRFLYARLWVRSVLLMDLLASILHISILGLLASAERLTAISALGAMALSYAVTGGIWFFALRGAYEMHWLSLIKFISTNWTFGKYVLASAVAWTLCFQMCPWMLAAFHDRASVAVWAACLAVAGLANPFITGVQNYLAPRMTHAYANQGPLALKRTGLWGTLTLCGTLAPFILLLLIFGDWFVKLLFGEEYAGTGNLPVMIAASYLVAAAGYASSRGLFALNLAKIEFGTNAVGLLVSFTLGIWLIFSFGVWGAATGLLLSSLSATLLRKIAFSRAVRSAEVETTS